VLLWQKLLRTGIDGKILTVIQNLYKSAKSCVRDGNTYSEYFVSNIGVLQYHHCQTSSETYKCIANII
jgi:hypothetical protein